MAPESLENVTEAADTQARKAMQMAQDFSRDARDTLEEWMADADCLLALGDSDGLNFATPSEELAGRLRAQYKVAKR